MTGADSGDKEMVSEAARQTGRDLDAPRGNKRAGGPENARGAEEKEPVGASEVASEAN